MITAGVFIYIIIITALPGGAGGEQQGRGRDEEWDRRREEVREEMDSKESSC